MRWARCTMRFNSVGPLLTRRFWVLPPSGLAVVGPYYVPGHEAQCYMSEALQGRGERRVGKWWLSDGRWSVVVVSGKLVRWCLNSTLSSRFFFISGSIFGSSARWELSFCIYCIFTIVRMPRGVSSLAWSFSLSTCSFSGESHRRSRERTSFILSRI